MAGDIHLKTLISDTYKANVERMTAAFEETSLFNWMYTLPFMLTSEGT